MSALVGFEVADRVAYITIQRAEKRNALSPELVSGLYEAFTQAAETDACKVVVLRAEGKVFSAGADLAYLQQMQDFSREENLADSRRLMDLFQLIYTFPKAVIAQVEGHAIAGGCGLMSVCDVIFTVPEAKFGYTEVRIGFIPAIVSCYLIRRIGEGRTRELLLSGDLITAEQAHAYNLVNFVVEPQDMALKVQEYARMLVEKTSANSIRETKALLTSVQDMDLLRGLDLAVQRNAAVRASADCRSGISSFLEGKPINWFGDEHPQQ